MHPYYHRLKSDEPFTFAGLWEWWKGDGEELLTCAILTTDANELAAKVHDRMPVILDGAEALAWMDPETDAEAACQMLRPFDASKMVAFPIGQAVGNVKNHGSQLIEPIVLS